MRHEKPERIYNEDEPTRAEVNAAVNERGVDMSDFIQRTRNYVRLTRAPKRPQYARGLETKPEDFA